MRVLKVQAFVRTLRTALSLHRAERCELIDEAQGAGARPLGRGAASKIELKYDSKCFFNGMYGEPGERGRKRGQGGGDTHLRIKLPPGAAKMGGPDTARRRPVDATHGFNKPSNRMWSL